MIFMAKFADYNNLDRWKGHILDELSAKSRSGHSLTSVNGKTIVISNTAPSVNNENVITLIVDAAHVPDLSDIGGLSLDVLTHYIVKVLCVTWMPMYDVHYVFQAYYDDEPVSAMYQLEDNNNNVAVAASNSREIIASPIFSPYNVRVFYEEHEKVFSLSELISSYDESVINYRLPIYTMENGSSGFYRNGEFFYDKISYLDASDGVSLRWVYPEGFDSSELISITVDRYHGGLNAEGAVTIDDVFSTGTLESKGAAIIGSGFVSYTLSDTFTKNDIDSEAIYIFNGTFSDGMIIRALYSMRIKDVPVSESFVGHIVRYAFNEAYTSSPQGPQSNDNTLQRAESSSIFNRRIYFYFETDVEFTYDIEIRVKDSSDVALSSSSKFLVSSFPDVITMSAENNFRSVSGYLRVSTAGTYYLVADVVGVGTNYEQSLVIEVDVT